MFIFYQLPVVVINLTIYRLQSSAACILVAVHEGKLVLDTEAMIQQCQKLQPGIVSATDYVTDSFLRFHTQRVRVRTSDFEPTSDRKRFISRSTLYCTRNGFNFAITFCRYHICTMVGTGHPASVSISASPSVFAGDKDGEVNIQSLFGVDC